MYTEDQKTAILKEELLSHPNVNEVYFNEAGDWTFDSSNVGFTESKKRDDILESEKQNLKTKKTN